MVVVLDPTPSMVVLQYCTVTMVVVPWCTVQTVQILIVSCWVAVRAGWPPDATAQLSGRSRAEQAAT